MPHFNLNFEGVVSISALPTASSTYKSTFAFRTSDNTMWWCDGTSWIQVVSSGVSDGDKGDIVVSSSGSVWTIDTNVVTPAKMAQAPAFTLRGNNTASTANVADLTIDQINDMLLENAINSIYQRNMQNMLTTY